MRSKFYLIAATAGLIGGALSSHAAFFAIPNGDVTALKVAIAAANTNNEDDTIALAANGLYILTDSDAAGNGLPAVLADGGRRLSLQGNGATIQRSRADGTPLFRCLAVESDADLTVSRLTIAHAATEDFGAGILNEGSLSVDECSFFDNSGLGAGICNSGGILTVERTFFSANSGPDGGGISNAGQLVIRNSFFSGNSALGDLGGGSIYCEQEDGDTSVEIVNCTFAENSADDGGAIYANALSFGRINLIVNNCTFSGNSAAQGGAIFIRDQGNGDSFAFLRLTSDTFEDNSANFGGAVFSDAASGGGNTKLANTILKAGPSGGTLAGSAIVSHGHNVSSDSTSGILSAPGDQTNIDPKLDPSGLQNNGGATPTIGLLPDSPAINAGDAATALPFDQRSYLRRGATDIGAYEFNGIYLRITSIARTQSEVVISFQAAAGLTFELQRRLTQNDSWQTIPGVSAITPTSDGIAQIADPGGANFVRAFYRIVLAAD